MERNRVLYFDYLRVLATLGVIVLHVSAEFFYKVDVNTYNWQVFNLFDSIMRFCVPIFVMISGAIFLNRNVPFSMIYKKYILRLFTAFIFWKFIYFLFMGDSPIKQIQSLFSSGFLNQFSLLLTNHNHLWFITMIIGLYMFIPFMKKIIENKRICEYYLLLSFVFWILIPELLCLMNSFGGKGVASLVKAFSYNLDNMNMSMVLGYSFYFMLGYYLSLKKHSNYQRKLIYILGILGLLFTITITKYLSLKSGRPVTVYYEYMRLNVLFVATGVFELFKNIKFKDNILSKIISKLSILSFGVYLVHMFVFEQGYKFLNITTFTYNPLIFIPILSISILAISYFISFVISNIPILKKYII
mgnify:FL=1